MTRIKLKIRHEPAAQKMHVLVMDHVTGSIINRAIDKLYGNPAGTEFQYTIAHYIELYEIGII